MNKINVLSRALLGGLLLAAAGAPALAEDPASGGWIVTLGMQTSYGPSYPGARNTDIGFMPSFDIRDAGEPATFGAPDDDLSITLFKLGGISMGPTFSLRGSRPNNALFGLPGYSTAPQFGVFAEFWPLDKAIRLRGEIRQGVKEDDGITGTLGLDWVTYAGPLTFGIGPRLQFADSSAMQTAFGVTPLTTFINPTLTPYTPGAGVTSTGLAGSVAFSPAQSWTTTLFGGYDRLVGAAAASPVTKRLDGVNQMTFGVSLEREFSFP
ncbi:outer membrane scaffolding protein for murein synthesis (MipA/OmpV family) [Azorhizobium sp. AG788]|jgi:outer membrane protein|uniref:MipA/OmpV family protein n=1 Tax=Azorhizobium sp. AG788 TaxID=2183897 RepID=UPI00105F1575|nr:MipA/OmpV family protein [Azorhizobium sp. AG788]TDT94666.1 outer membrane scaffolding protein for murein synthesis (MipA/OmpV family) [Azorhizobium sp. AG788]